MRLAAWLIERPRWFKRTLLITNDLLLLTLAIWAAYQLAIGFTLPFVDNFAHLGGLVGGGLATLLARPRGS